MTRPAILAIDQGTTNSKVLLVADDGTVLARASRPLGVTHPQPGWAEQSALVLWDSVASAITDVLGQGVAVEIAAVAIANQRETIVAWDVASGAPVAPAITWQCRRSSPLCARLRAEGAEPLVVERTGLGLDPLFPSGKIVWLLEQVPAARALAEAGQLRVGTVDTWLLWRLSGGQVHATDVSNASRTQLFGLDALAWDAEMLALFGVPASVLPEVLPSDSRFGETAAGTSPLPAGVPIHAMLGDSHAALLGHGFARAGQAKVTCGTGSSIMATTPARPHSHHGLAATIAWQRAGEPPVHALEGNVAVSGHAAAFAAALLGFADEAALTAAAAAVPDSGGVVFVPALAGLGAPHWDDAARGLLSGMTLATGRSQVARAVLEGIALQIGDLVAALDADLGAPLETLSVDGGASRNDLLMQMLADVIGRPVRRPHLAEIGALGAARLAAAALGLDAGTAMAQADRFEPALPQQARAALLQGWREAIARARLRL